MRDVLVLNSSEEVIHVVGWQKAVTLVELGKARKPHGHDDFYEVKKVDGIYSLPTAIALVEYARIPFKKVAVTKENVLRRDGFECAYCGKKLSNSTGTIDHVHPRSRGGRHKWANVVASCKPCNNEKDNKLLSEIKMKLRWKPYVPSRDVLVLTGHSLRNNKSWSRWVMT
jgi:5-methylcytosine-specific restriction endonuclease McrA